EGRRGGAAAQPARARGDPRRGRGAGAAPARGVDAEAVPGRPAHQGDGVLARAACGMEARGRLHEVGTGALGRLADGDDLLIGEGGGDRKSTRLNSSHVSISYAVFCLKKKIKTLEDCAINMSTTN